MTHFRSNSIQIAVSICKMYMFWLYLSFSFCLAALLSAFLHFQSAEYEAV